MTDEEILLGIRAGGGRADLALKLLHNRYWRKMMSSFVYRGSSPQEAEDIIQETFIKIFQNADAFRGDAPPAAWFWRIAKNCWIDKIRQSQPELVSDDCDDDPIDVLKGPLTDDPAHAETPTECVSRALQRFRGRYPEAADAIRMQLDGESIADIANVLNRTYAATNVFLFGAKKRFAAFLADCIELLDLPVEDSHARTTPKPAVE